jgi:hypothetical protein
MSEEVAAGLFNPGAIAGTVNAVTGPWSAYMNQQQNEANLAFQEDIAQHGITWQMEDYANAGLNPILAATGGLQGAGAKASGGSSIPIQNPMDGLTSALSLLKQNSEIKLNESVAQKNSAEANEKIANEERIKEEILIAKLNNIIKQHEASAARSKSKKAHFENVVQELDAHIYSQDYAAAIRLMEKPAVAGLFGGLAYSIKGYLTAAKKLKTSQNIVKSTENTYKAKKLTDKMIRNRNRKRNRRN